MQEIIFEMKLDNPETGEFSGLASVYGNIDSHGDIVEKGAFTRTLDHRGGKVPVLWQHRSDQPIGLGELTDSDEGLRIKGRLNMKVAKAVEALALMKQGVIKDLSIGFNTVKELWDEGIRHLKELDLWEISTVTFGSNDRAIILDVKSRNLLKFHGLPLTTNDRQWDASAARKRVKDWATDKKDGGTWMEKFSQAFILCDNKDRSEKFDAYKMQIADVVNDKLVVVPRGVFAAAASLGNEEIPGVDLPRIKSHLGMYYSKMGITPPWQTCKVFDTELTQVIGQCEVLKDGQELTSENKQLIRHTLSSLRALLKSTESKEDSGNHSSKDTEDKGLSTKGEHVLSPSSLTFLTNIAESIGMFIESAKIVQDEPFDDRLSDDGMEAIKSIAKEMSEYSTSV